MTRGQGRLPATAPEKWLTSGPGPPSAAAPQDQSGERHRVRQQVRDRFSGSPGGRGWGLDPGFLDDRSRSLKDHRLGAKLRLISIAAWTPPH